MAVQGMTRGLIDRLYNISLYLILLSLFDPRLSQGTSVIIGRYLFGYMADLMLRKVYLYDPVQVLLFSMIRYMILKESAFRPIVAGS